MHYSFAAIVLYSFHSLQGLDHSGTEFACIQNNGMFDGPHNSSLVSGLKSWHSNSVRVPLNEDCWLGINGVNPQYSGSNYQQALTQYVKMFTDADMVVILDLHWTAPGGSKATGQQPMPNMDHSVEFWRQVAKKFSDNDKVILELFNEPYPDNGNWDSDNGWKCWRDGGSACNGLNFQAAGMQSLLSAVRSTGAKNVVLLGGLAWSNSIDKWLNYLPSDPVNNTAAAWHSYNFNYCNNQNCWESSVGKVKAKYPVVCTEFGENDCTGGYVTNLMNWMDQKGISYLAWTYNAWDCKGGPALISSYDNGGQPTGYGSAVKSHYASRAMN